MKNLRGPIKNKSLIYKTKRRRTFCIRRDVFFASKYENAQGATCKSAKVASHKMYARNIMYIKKYVVCNGLVILSVRDAQRSIEIHTIFKIEHCVPKAFRKLLTVLKIYKSQHQSISTFGSRHVFWLYSAVWEERLYYQIVLLIL